jgi:hypothetical protein
MKDTITTLGKLETIARFVNAHDGNRGEVYPLGFVRIYSTFTQFVDNVLTLGTITDDVRTMQEARDVLGY